MSIIIRSPTMLPVDNKKSLYLSGNCINYSWRDSFITGFNDVDMYIVDPRVLDYDKNQTDWEYTTLRNSSGVCFYFDKSSISSISLLELGMSLELPKPIWVCIHPEYTKRLVIERYISLRRSYSQVFYSLEKVLSNIRDVYSRWTDIVPPI